LASFNKATEIGVDAIELDVRKTKENQLVVIRDAKILSGQPTEKA